MTEWFEGAGLDDAHQRCFWRRVAALFLGLLALAVILAPLVGCASAERYLTEEQDAEMRNVCAPAGCEVIPTPIWMQIEAILKRHGTI